MNKTFKVIRNILLLSTIGLQLLARNVSGFGDWYVQNIYPLLVKVIGGISSRFPFSLSEVLVYAIFILLVFWIFQSIRIRKLSYIKQKLIQASCIIVILFFLYTAGCGINYYSMPFSRLEGYELKEHTVDDLKQLCLLLVRDVNEAAALSSFNEEGVFTISNEAARREARQVMMALGEIYPSLTGYYPMPKYLINSSLLSVQKLSGIYSPFTVEANVNKDMPAINIPVTLCHELSHLKGFMREDEANFIAYLACMESGLPEFHYSGSMLAFTYSMNQLYRAGDIEGYWEVWELLDVQAERDLVHDSQFWRQYTGKVAETANLVNDTYLKANNQKDGVSSYGRVVDLLLAYYDIG